MKNSIKIAEIIASAKNNQIATRAIDKIFCKPVVIKSDSINVKKRTSNYDLWIERLRKEREAKEAWERELI